jgi:hypothetical protein
MAARCRRDFSHRAWRAAVSFSRICCEAWAYRPRMPGTWCPSRCSARISGMPSSAIHVLWPCRRPCGVRPSLTGSQQASGASPAGCSPLPGQCPGSLLWAMILPSSRSLTACPQDGQRPVSPVLISRWVPLPDGGANGLPPTAGGHAADHHQRPDHQRPNRAHRLPGPRPPERLAGHLAPEPGNQPEQRRHRDDARRRHRLRRPPGPPDLAAPVPLGSRAWSDRLRRSCPGIGASTRQDRQP